MEAFLTPHKVKRKSHVEMLPQSPAQLQRASLRYRPKSDATQTL
jgi:hypothetical protein